MNLILFDIDGTLLNTHGAGKLAFEEAISRVCNRNIDLSNVDWLGRVDGEIINETLLRAGFSDIEIRSLVPVIFEEYVSRLRVLSEKNRNGFEIMPGVKTLLSVLNEHPIGLITGNILSAAFVKLGAVGLDSCFPYGVGGFGDDCNIRSELVKIAIDRASGHYDSDFKRAVVIGDSARDIEAVRSCPECGCDIISVAVATGGMDIQTLSKYNPDFLFPDLSDLNKVVNIITS
jgi:phosphoglycolate phosphatase-like HAD superfamily hydrolase